MSNSRYNERRLDMDLRPHHPLSCEWKGGVCRLLAAIVVNLLTTFYFNYALNADGEIIATSASSTLSFVCPISSALPLFSL